MSITNGFSVNIVRNETFDKNINCVKDLMENQTLLFELKMNFETKS